MIIKLSYCPGPHWRLLPVEFVVSEKSGQRVATSTEDRFWFWDPACQ